MWGETSQSCCRQAVGVGVGGLGPGHRGWKSHPPQPSPELPPAPLANTTAHNGSGKLPPYCPTTRANQEPGLSPGVLSWGWWVKSSWERQNESLTEMHGESEQKDLCIKGLTINLPSVKWKYFLHRIFGELILSGRCCVSTGNLELKASYKSMKDWNIHVIWLWFPKRILKCIKTLHWYWYFSSLRSEELLESILIMHLWKLYSLLLFRKKEFYITFKRCV